MVPARKLELPDQDFMVRAMQLVCADFQSCRYTNDKDKHWQVKAKGMLRSVKCRNLTSKWWVFAYQPSRYLLFNTWHFKLGSYYIWVQAWLICVCTHIDVTIHSDHIRLLEASLSSQSIFWIYLYFSALSDWTRPRRYRYSNHSCICHASPSISQRYHEAPPPYLLAASDSSALRTQDRTR